MRKTRAEEIRKTLMSAMLAIIALYLLGKIFLSLIVDLVGSYLVAQHLAYIMAATIAWIIAYLAYRSYVGEGILVLKSIDINNILKGFVVALILATVSSVIRSVISNIVANELVTGSNTEDIALNSSLKGFLLITVSLVIVAPIVEELIFRGLVMDVLWELIGLNKAILISSVGFAVIHGTSLITLIFSFCMGLNLAYVYSKNRTLTESIIVHMLYNGAVTIGSL